LMHGDMLLEQQRSHISQSIEAIESATGQRPVGWLSQDWGTTADTPGLLAQAGIRFTLDWCNDDQPYWMTTDPALLSIPLSAEWDDVQSQWLRHIEPRAHVAMTADAFHRLRAECATHQRGAVFGLALHPWLCGMPSRITALRHLLKELLAHGDVHWTSPHAIHEAITEKTRHESC
jgi:allantoinase